MDERGTLIANDPLLMNMRRTSYRTRIRDLAILGSTLAVLLLGSLALNDQWRQSLSSASMDAHDVATSQTMVAVNHAAGSLTGAIKGFAQDNTFLFGFLVATAVLVVLMLRT
jgi:hypothetical protein